MNPEEVKKQIDQAASDSQYNVAPVSFHTHNGTDSPVVATITGLGITNGAVLSGDVVLAAGANVTVSESNQTITIAVPTVGLTTSFDYQEFTVAGTNTWTKPAGATANSPVYVQEWGAGGGGGGVNAGGSGGGGGGGGEYVDMWFKAGALNSTVGLTVGAGGAGGVNGAGSGATGGSSLFPTSLPSITARGGVGGQGSAAGQRGGAGGGYFPGTDIGGGAGTYDSLDQFSGAAGGSNTVNGGYSPKGGGGGGGGAGPGTTGGRSGLGGAGADGHAGESAGATGNVPGGGGSGATGGISIRAGGQGGAGTIRIWTFL